jgi:hypothetical protein
MWGVSSNCVSAFSVGPQEPLPSKLANTAVQAFAKGLREKTKKARFHLIRFVGDQRTMQKQIRNLGSTDAFLLY